MLTGTRARTGRPGAPMASPRVLLVSMPFVSISRPAIGISILKAVLERPGHPVRCRAMRICASPRAWAPTPTASLDERVSDALFAGEWLFAQHLFGDQLDLARSTPRRCKRNVGDAASTTRIMAARAARRTVPARRASRNIRIADYDIVGFTTTFEQNLASLALARLDQGALAGQGHRVRRRQLRRGDGTRSSTAAFRGSTTSARAKASSSFPRLVEAMAAGSDGAGIPGIVYRRDGRSTTNGRGEAIPDLDARAGARLRRVFRRRRAAARSCPCCIRRC